MTQYEIRTTMTEADQIAAGFKDFVFRNDKNLIGVGDDITFRAYKDGKPTRHRVDRLKFKVVYVDADAPIEDGFKVLGFRRVNR